MALLTVCLIAAAATALLLGRQSAVADRGPQVVAPSSSAPPTAGPTPSSSPSDDVTDGQPTPSAASSVPSVTSSAPAPTSSRLSTPTPSTPAPSTPEPPTSAPATPVSSAPQQSVPATGPAELDPPVELSEQAAAHPDAAAIQELVSLNFKAINTLDYQLWADTVTLEQSEALGPEDWLEAYRTSKDRGIEIVSIAPDTRWVTMTFSSSQAIDKAPADAPSTCLDWKVVRPVVTVNEQLRLAKSVEGLASYRPCQ